MNDDNLSINKKGRFVNSTKFCQMPAGQRHMVASIIGEGDRVGKVAAGRFPIASTQPKGNGAWAVDGAGEARRRGAVPRGGSGGVGVHKVRREAPGVQRPPQCGVRPDRGPRPHEHFGPASGGSGAGVAWQ